MVYNALDCTHTSMYCQCPGLANEHVPLNETGYLLPLPQVCTAVLCCAVVQLVCLSALKQRWGLLGAPGGWRQLPGEPPRCS